MRVREEAPAVKVNAFTENLEQKVRYMLSKQAKYKATDVLNQKKVNVDSFQRIMPLAQNARMFSSNRTGGASVWDKYARPKLTSAAN